MERTFEDVSLGWLGYGAITVEIAVPLAVLRVGEMGLGVVQGLEVPVQILLLPGIPVEHQGGNQDLVMGPPELHVMLVSLGGIAESVYEI